MPVTIDSDSGADHYQITLDKTGNDTGTIRLRSWPKGSNPAKVTPSKDDSYRLIRIKAAADGGRIVCRADVLPFYHPTVTCTVNGPTNGAQPSVEVAVAGHDDEYPVSQTDHDKIKAFIVAAHFPVLS